MRVCVSCRVIVWSCLFLCLSACVTQAQTITLFVTGDVLLGPRTELLRRQANNPFRQYKAQITQADLAFCNLECVLTTQTQSASRHPKLIAPINDAAELSTAGFDIVSLANNHSLDAGESGLRSTLSALSHNHVSEIGAQLGTEPWQADETTVHGRSIAWVAASEYGPWNANTAHTRNIRGTGLTEQVRALAHRGDIVCVSLHWGNEYRRIPTEGQRQLAHALIDSGASVIIGHHPHVAQPIEIYHGHPIFYSLGNFVFDTLPGRTQDGITATVTIKADNTISYKVHALSQPPIGKGETVISSLAGYFVRGVSQPQVITWAKQKTGGYVLRAFIQNADAWHCVAVGHHHAIFDLQVGDIDHDGLDEVLVGLRQRSKLDINVQTRLHIYSVDADRGFKPRWRGSALARPFRRFWLLPQRIGCDLVALERNPLPDYKDFDWLGVYRWNGFGLRQVWNTPVRGRVSNLTLGQNGDFSFDQKVGNEQRRLTLHPSVTAENDIEFRAAIVR